MIGDSNDEINFPHKLLLNNRQVSNIRKAFADNSSADIKFSKAQLSKMIQSGGFLGKITRFINKNRITFNSKCNKTIS